MKMETPPSPSPTRAVKVDPKDLEKVIDTVQFDDEDDVEEVEVVDLDGFLQKRHGDNKKAPTGTFKWSTRWFILRGGTLFLYQSAADVNPKKIFELDRASIDTQSHKEISPYSFVVKKDKLYLLLAASNEEEFKEWLRALREAIGKPASKPPKRLKNKKNGLSLKAKKKIGERIVTSNVGKSILREMVNEETYLVMNCIQTFITKESGSKVATTMYNNILKLIVKLYILCRDGALTQKEFWEALKLPLWKVFSELIDSLELSFSFDPHQLSKDVIDLGKVFEKVLAPFFSNQSIAELKEIFGYFSNPTVWTKLYTDDTYSYEINTTVKSLRKLWNSIRYDSTEAGQAAKK